MLIEHARPAAGSLRVSLDQLDELALERGGERGVACGADGTSQTLRLPDRQMSRRHARLARGHHAWWLEDLGSTNGTSIAGDRIARRTLIDGDIFQVGSTTLLFRDSVVPPGYAVPTGATSVGAVPEVLQTLMPSLEQHFAQMARVAASRLPVVIRGETGTGKELLAQAIHQLSGRAGPFVAVNCGALPRSLLESELFGYRRGAFSGANDPHDGLVRRAHGGTLFLDEIAELPPDAQAALLRVLQEGEVRPLGSSEAMRVDVRIVAASHQHLTRRVEAGAFREDLYARLAGFTAELPPLRARLDDLGVLVANLLSRVAPASAARIRLRRDAVSSLLAHPYPRNVRELEQALHSAVVLRDDSEIRVEHLRLEPGPAAGDVDTDGADPAELPAQLSERLKESRGNVAAVARAMGKAPTQIRRWCRRFGIDPDGFRDPGGDRHAEG
ncbi:MAG: sigma 54-interacting transcriptional regulator [Kofleriaceae bacterium]|nr:sigma 54-interacting transcriptional regulator [Kofleriaceae bacterium]